MSNPEPRAWALALIHSSPHGLEWRCLLDDARWRAAAISKQQLRLLNRSTREVAWALDADFLRSLRQNLQASQPRRGPFCFGGKRADAERLPALSAQLQTLRAHTEALRRQSTADELAALKLQQLAGERSAAEAWLSEASLLIENALQANPPPPNAHALQSEALPILREEAHNIASLRAELQLTKTALEDRAARHRALLPLQEEASARLELALRLVERSADVADLTAAIAAVKRLAEH